VLAAHSASVLCWFTHLTHSRLIAGPDRLVSCWSGDRYRLPRFAGLVPAKGSQYSRAAVLVGQTQEQSALLIQINVGASWLYLATGIGRRPRGTPGLYRVRKAWYLFFRFGIGHGRGAILHEACAR
jgi:hypothetical protein